MSGCHKDSVSENKLSNYIVLRLLEHFEFEFDQTVLQILISGVLDA